MRQFASGGFRIWNLSTEAKLVYTGFGLMSLLALVVSVLLYEDMVGPRTGGVAGYYAGARSAPTTAAPPVAGPKLELPPEEGDADSARSLQVAVSYRKLLETTHFHLFTVPVFLLIIAHLFMLTSLATRTKAAWVVLAWLSSLAHLAAPWLIRFSSPSWRWLFPTTGVVMTVSLGFMTVFPIVVMWLPRPRKEPTPAV